MSTSAAAVRFAATALEFPYAGAEQRTMVEEGFERFADLG
jgi:hypothetical protein